ncbi:transcriptional regulator, partial [Actinoplanes sp. ATCC 53533]
FIKAMTSQALSKNVVTNPVKLDKVLKAAGDTLIFDGNGHTVVDWGLALKGLRSDDMTLVKLPGRSLITNGDYLGEELEPGAEDFFASVQNDTVSTFLVEHPDFLQKL